MVISSSEQRHQVGVLNGVLFLHSQEEAASANGGGPEGAAPGGGAIECKAEADLAAPTVSPYGLRRREAAAAAAAAAMIAAAAGRRAPSADTKRASSAEKEAAGQLPAAPAKPQRQRPTARNESRKEPGDSLFLAICSRSSHHACSMILDRVVGCAGIALQAVQKKIAMYVPFTGVPSYSPTHSLQLCLDALTISAFQIESSLVSACPVYCRTGLCCWMLNGPCGH